MATSSDDALTELANRTATAVGEVIRMLVGDAVEIGSAAVTDQPELAFAALDPPLILSEVAYVDGVTGGNVLGITLSGARRIAASMGADPGDDDAQISEMGMSAVSELANQMLAAAGATTAAVLAHAVDIGAPETRLIEDLAAALAPYQAIRHATSISFTVSGEQCRLVQFIPDAFVIRLTAAVDKLKEEEEALAPDTLGFDASLDAVAASSVARTRLHVGVELGRTHMTIGQVTGLPDGAIVALDRKASDPIDVCVNGVPFAYGRLVRSDEGIAVVIEGFAGLAADPPGASAGLAPPGEPFSLAAARASTQDSHDSGMPEPDNR